MGYIIEVNTNSKEEIIEKFKQISFALECAETHEFRFSTNSLDDAKSLIFKLDNYDEIEISVKDKFLLNEHEDFTDFYDLLKMEPLQLVNLTITKRGDETTDDFYTSATVVKRNKYRGVSLNGTVDLPKTKKSQTKFFDYYSKFYNSCFELANLKTRASIEVSDGTKSNWKIGKKGVDIIRNPLDDASEIKFRNWYFTDGCHMIDFHTNINENSSITMSTLFDKISKTAYFTNTEADFTIWGYAPILLDVIEKNNLKFDTISNIVSLDIKTNKSLLDAMLQIPSFNGRVELIRPYSFQNSLSDSLGLSFANKELNINLRSSMTSSNTIEKFIKMLSKKINDNVILKRTNLF